uniref:Protein DPCD n=1 Tax=Strigamia maritima TaxID=126957 RepID=T1IIQ7_STRMM
MWFCKTYLLFDFPCCLAIFCFVMSSWLDLLRIAEKSCLIQDGKRKVHYKFPNDDEMVEEYDLKTNLLLRRKWRRKSTIGRYGDWENEVGEPEVTGKPDAEFKESSSNPIFIRKDILSAFQWRVRNLPYQQSVYSVTVDSNNKSITIRTTNKKYFKTFTIPDMERMKLPLEQKRLQFTHSNNTLIITVRTNFFYCLLFNEKLMVLLRDGRTLIGYLRSIDQFANLVLHRTIERIHVGQDYGDIPRGIFVVRGENVVLLGEIDNEKEQVLPLKQVSIDEILEAQRIEQDTRQEQDKIRNKALKERGLNLQADTTQEDF